MTTSTSVLRSDLRDFNGYSSARSIKQVGTVWLNANESAQPNPVDSAGLCQRYPEPQPSALVRRLAEYYDVAPEQLLVGRGSDEGIDLLVRTFCMPAEGCVLIAPPTFGMYAVSARLHGARVVDVPLRDTPNGFLHDLEGIVSRALSAGASLVFLCNPGNPTGSMLRLDELSRVAEALAGRALLVIDEAYGEYDEAASAATLIDNHDNVVVLRTLSKAHALAAARIGSVLARADVIEMLRRVQAPYPLPAPCVAIASDALKPEAIRQLQTRIDDVRSERDRLRTRLSALASVRYVYPSKGNFLLARFHDAEAVQTRLSEAGIVVRDMRQLPQLGDALRISIGSSAENTAVIDAIESLSRVAA